MIPAADIRRSRMIVEEEAAKAFNSLVGKQMFEAAVRTEIEKAIWRALSREQSYRIDEGWAQPLQTAPAGD